MILKPCWHYLVPRLTSQVEDAATDALAHILNRSPECRVSLRHMLEKEAGFELAALARFQTQVTYKDGSRPDMAGFDRDGRKRLLVESKFWAALGSSQPGYIDQFDHPESAVLLFIAPEARTETLWTEICRQFRAAKPTLEETSSTPGRRSARLLDSECNAARSVVFTSWRLLLDDLDAATGKSGTIASDLVQLRGLAVRQDQTSFLPVHEGDLGPEFGRRIASYCQLTDDLIGRGTGQGWMSISGLQATSQRWGYGRYFRFIDQSGWQSGALWLGINHEQWASTGDTPIWFRCEWRQTSASAVEIAEKLSVQFNDLWIPVHLPKGVEYEEVLDSASATLKSIARIMRVSSTGGQDDGSADSSPSIDPD